MFYHNLNPNITLGYHGCDEEIGHALIEGEEFIPSENDYDWLGHGIYFWEANPLRALQFAEDQVKRGRIKKPFVVGCALSLGNCIDLMSEQSILGIKQAYQELSEDLSLLGKAIPQNTGGPDEVFKNLDCAVIMWLHKLIAEADYSPADSLRGLYHEGKPLYKNAAFYEKTHIQLCIRNLDCIKGVFKANFD